MRKFPTPIHNAVAALGKLPGVGPKTALRYVFALLRFTPNELENIARAIAALRYIQVCQICLTYSEQQICSICSDEKRHKNILCVVSEARDIATIEATETFKGTYFVLGGVLNPVEGKTPEQLNIKKLTERLEVDRNIEEIILAFSPDIHGETTIMFLARKLKPLQKKITKLARGLPMGADIEYADEVTLGDALLGRKDA